MASEAPAVPRRQLFLDGEWKEPALGKRIPVVNPATEAVIGDVPSGTAEDIEVAVDAARRALTRNKGRDWSRATGAHRAKFLRAIAAKITERKSELAKLEALDCGKPFDEAAWDMDDVAACFEYYADLGEALDDKQRAPVSLPMETFKSYVLKEPVGVVGLITPWNYPLLMAAWKVAPALAAGCTAVLKPSELSSVTCLELADVCKEVGLPPGVLNIVTGLGPEAGAPLASHPLVDKIAFTGSTETGRRIMTAAAQMIKPVSLELGGKSPIIIFEDVDIDKAVEWALFGCFWTNGQICSATSRLVLHITERKSELAKLEALDCGKPFDEAAWDMDDVAACFEYYADLGEALDDKQRAPVSLPMETFKSYVLKEPVGVVGLITPWNYPLLMAAWKVAPALAAGCTAVLKPSELSSVTCLELADVCKEVGLPPGVLNIVTGLGPEAGAPLASHPLVDKIAFTGSTETGRRIMTAAAQMIKPVSLELGGKSPIIIFEDVDIDKAVEWALFGCFWTNGQICSATSRLVLHESIAEEFLMKLVSWAANIKVSDPFEEGCRLGPVVSEGQYEKIKKCISTAKNEGATILYGGRRPQHLEKGFFIEPTIITNVETSMQIWREEVFGPVLCVKTFRMEDEAIDLANDTHYGLAGAVLSRDPERCNRLTEAIQAGVIWVNCSQPCFCQAPWGGTKRSGFGRELGEWGLENYLSVKQVTEYISNDPWGWYQSPSKL